MATTGPISKAHRKDHEQMKPYDPAIYPYLKNKNLCLLCPLDLEVNFFDKLPVEDIPLYFSHKCFTSVGEMTLKRRIKELNKSFNF
jgi:hypothetical protein